jgi:hypothetical protein
MPRCGRPARRAVSRPVCANEKNPALSVNRKPLGTSKPASHPARPVPAVAPHGPRCSADACRSAIGRPILHGPRCSADACRSAIGRPILQPAFALADFLCVALDPSRKPQPVGLAQFGRTESRGKLLDAHGVSPRGGRVRRRMTNSVSVYLYTTPRECVKTPPASQERACGLSPSRG